MMRSFVVLVAITTRALADPQNAVVDGWLSAASVGRVGRPAFTSSPRNQVIISTHACANACMRGLRPVLTARARDDCALAWQRACSSRWPWRYSEFSHHPRPVIIGAHVELFSRQLAMLLPTARYCQLADVPSSLPDTHSRRFAIHVAAYTARCSHFTSVLTSTNPTPVILRRRL
jgi:hypothetical protein